MATKQVYQFTKSGATNTWTIITTGNFAWTTETEEEYLAKLGFNINDYFFNDPNFLTGTNTEHNQLFQTLVFYNKSDTPPIVNTFEGVLYMRIAEKEHGVMFLCENLGDFIFLLNDLSPAMGTNFRLKR